MGFFPGQQVPKTIVQGTSQPQAVNKETGEIVILVRDDTAVNGKLYIAPVGAMTSMRSIKPEQFKAEFEWYVPPKERPLPVREVQNQMNQSMTPLIQQAVDTSALPQVEAGGPIGPFVPFDQPEVTPEVVAAAEEVTAPDEVPKKRGRPKGSKNKTKRRPRKT